MSEEISIEEKTFDAFKPLSWSYDPKKNDVKIQQTVKTFSDGLSFATNSFTKTIEDFAFDQKTAVILTSVVSLSSIFEKPAFVTIPTIPFSGFLSPRTYRQGFFLEAVGSKVKLAASREKASIVTFSPLPNGLTEIFIDGKYLQVMDEPPYEAVLSETALDETQIIRQQFEVSIILPVNCITICASIPTENQVIKRYLACGSDNILRACGLELNNFVLNDYHFSIDGTLLAFWNNGNQKDVFVSYFSETDSEILSATEVGIKKQISSPSHFVVVSPTNKISENEEIAINFFRLKTNYTKDEKIVTFTT